MILASANATAVRAAILSVCMLLLTACAGMSKPELQAIGSTITPVSVNFGELYDYAGRSRAAYAPETMIRSQYPKTIRIATPGKTGTRYFIERDDTRKTQTVTVRGTADKKNFSEDLNIKIRKDEKSGIPVDSGFDAVAVLLYADMKPFLNKDYKSYVTGHSLGGAVAALLAIYMSEDGHSVLKVVTFGQPKFTTASGVQRLGFLPITRVVDEDDVIPMLPPDTLRNAANGPYEHVGPEIILLEGTDYVYLPAHNAERLSVGEFWRTIGIADLKDHKMERYLQRLSTKLKGATEVTYNQRQRYVAKRKQVTVN